MRAPGGCEACEGRQARTGSMRHGGLCHKACAGHHRGHGAARPPGRGSRGRGAVAVPRPGRAGPRGVAHLLACAAGCSAPRWKGKRNSSLLPRLPELTRITLMGLVLSPIPARPGPQEEPPGCRLPLPPLPGPGPRLRLPAGRGRRGQIGRAHV